ncbi:MAG: HEPN domain-containing protein [Atribacterota bacterium]|nr:HEPN domain-containing protein [Atribacterota bacterium]
MISKNQFSEKEYKQLCDFVNSVYNMRNLLFTNSGQPFLVRNDIITYCDTITNIIRPKINKKITIDVRTILTIIKIFSIKLENKVVTNKADLTDEFLNSVNSYINSINIINYTLVYPLNITLDVNLNKQDEFLKVINKLSGIKIYKSLSDAKLNIEEVKKIKNFDEYLSGRLIATFQCNCGDEDRLLFEFHKDLNYLYGLIALGFYQFDFNQYLTHAFIKYKKDFKIPESLFYIVYKNEKLDAIINDWISLSITENNLKKIVLNTNGLKLVSIHNKEIKNNRYPYIDIINIINPVQKIINNKTLYRLFEEVLSIYYDAISDNYAPTAYLKYFIICEKILKIGKKQNENTFKLELLRISNYVSIYYPTEHKREILDRLFEKRNKLVHEYDANITEIDLNLMKMISESVIQFVFYDFIKYYSNPKELEFFIENFTLDNDELIKKQDLLTKIKKDDELNLVKYFKK